MASVPIHQVKSHLSEILRRVEAGETIVVTRHNRVVAEIRAPAKLKPRRFGAFEGEFQAPESAFAALSEEELKDWYGD